tara:strand:+ start:933 stop:1151 length:219 start_codon:yes stop_codon:yes gene_type:complete
VAIVKYQIWVLQIVDPLADNVVFVKPHGEIPMYTTEKEAKEGIDYYKSIGADDAEKLKPKEADITISGAVIF